MLVCILDTSVLLVIFVYGAVKAIPHRQGLHIEKRQLIPMHESSECEFVCDSKENHKNSRRRTESRNGHNRHRPDYDDCVLECSIKRHTVRPEEHRTDAHKHASAKKHGKHVTRPSKAPHVTNEASTTLKIHSRKTPGKPLAGTTPTALQTFTKLSPDGKSTITISSVPGESSKNTKSSLMTKVSTLLHDISKSTPPKPNHSKSPNPYLNGESSSTNGNSTITISSINGLTTINTNSSLTATASKTSYHTSKTTQSSSNNKISTILAHSINNSSKIPGELTVTTTRTSLSLISISGATDVPPMANSSDIPKKLIATTTGKSLSLTSISRISNAIPNPDTSTAKP